MSDRNQHLSDENLLLYADGELPFGQCWAVRTHLAACWQCRARMAQIEGTIADFVRAHHATFDDGRLQPADGPRALLKARLRDLSEKGGLGFFDRLRGMIGSHRLSYAAAGILLLLLGTALLLSRLAAHGHGGADASYASALPSPRLTPGATEPVALSALCASPHDEVVKRVSPSVRAVVFREYGLTGASAGDYEIDHLVTPGLGGSDDISNLWPEPHYRVEWNSYVKDQLEDHLHHLVCTGQISLTTAQQDMKSNWISAYKKYFDTDKPLLPYSSASTGSAPPGNSDGLMKFSSACVLLAIAAIFGALQAKYRLGGRLGGFFNGLRHLYPYTGRQAFIANGVPRAPALRAH